MIAVFTDFKGSLTVEIFTSPNIQNVHIQEFLVVTAKKSINHNREWKYMKKKREDGTVNYSALGGLISI